jgi:hypothetical protein
VRQLPLIFKLECVRNVGHHLVLAMVQLVRCYCHHSLRHYFVFQFKFEFLDGSATAWAARQMHRSYNPLQRAV